MSKVGQPTFGVSQSANQDNSEPVQHSQQVFKVVHNPIEEYGRMGADSLFLTEQLDENFDMVKEQMDHIRRLIIQYEEVSEDFKTDPDMDVYLDKLIPQIEEAFQSFKIKDKIVDIRELVAPGSYRQVFNGIVLYVNDYMEHYMRRSNKAPLQEIF